ncbi:hypothetical protein GCM10010302_40170 [Streptomyces polychromogenes]|uniref:Ricin B lectin domain-containing protein n=1 Tax=Streptomyces polychromogenes TaxID=67342 RepID=A0ABP3F343_9ACTN
MTKAGRPQGDLRGATGAANELARFLRDLTDGMSLRALAERYPGGRTLWGDYRSGAQLVPLSRLNAVIKDRVPDARGRQVMLAKARALHDAALTAEAERPAVGLDEALERAKRDIAEMGRLIKALLARIDALEGEAAEQSAGAVRTEVSGRPVETIAAQLDVLRQHVAEARRVRDLTLEAYGAAQSREAGGEEGPGAGGGELVGSLAALHDTATRHQHALRGWATDTPPPAGGAGAGGAEAGGAGGVREDGRGADAADGAAGARGEGSADPDGAGSAGGARGSGGTDAASGAAGARGEGGADPDGTVGAGGARGSGGTDAADGAARGSGGADAAGGAGGVPEEGSERGGTGVAGGPDSGGAIVVPGVPSGADSAGAEVDPVGHVPGREDDRRRGLRVPAGVGLVVLVAACVFGGMAIAKYQTGSGERGPEARLDTPATPGTGPASPAPAIDVPVPGSSGPSSEPSPDPSSAEPAEQEPEPAPKPEPPSPRPVVTPKEQAPAPKPAPAPAPVVGGGLRTWMNAGTQMCLEIRRSAGEDGATANQWTCNNSSSQKWTTTNPGGWTTLVHMDSRKCLEIRADSVEDGASANQWTCNGSPTQNWRWQAQPGGGWSLVNANSGKCLSIRGQGDGALAVQQPCDGSPLQTWN